MIAIDTIIGFIFYSNVFIAGSAVALHLSLCKILGWNPSIEIEFILFSIVLNFYNLCQFNGIKGKEKEEMSPLQLFIAHNMTELIFLLFFMNIISLYLFFNNINQFNWELIFLLGLAGCIYLIWNKQIQNAPFLKPIYITSCWVLFLFLPIKHSYDKILFETVVLIGTSILLLCFLYDQKDKEKHLFELIPNTIKFLIVGFCLVMILSMSYLIANNALSLYSLIILGLFSMVAFLGINKKKEIWHLILTDSQMYMIAGLLSTLK